MSVRVEGVIQVDISDYSDELELYADCEDICELMESNNITAGEMIDYLRDGEYRLDIDEIYQWLEMANVPALCAVSKKCIDLLRHEYTEAEEGRMAHLKRANQLEQWHSESQSNQANQLEAEQKVLTGGPHVS